MRSTLTPILGGFTLNSPYNQVSRAQHSLGYTNSRLGEAFHYCVVALLVVVVCGPLIFRRLRQPTSDFGVHLSLVQEGARSAQWPPHPLFHWTVYLVSGFAEQRRILGLAAFGVLCSSIALRGLFSFKYLQTDQMRRAHDFAELLGTTPLSLNAFLVLGYVFASPVINFWQEYLYMGQISPNVWESPTWIFAWPFCFLLFCELAASLGNNRWSVAKTVIVGGLSCLAKPNFAMAVIPAWVLWIIVLKGCHIVTIGRAILSVVVLSAVLGWQYYAYYGISGNRPEGLVMVIAPFQVWHQWSRCIPGSLVISFLFPGVYALCYWRDALRSIDLRLAWTTMGFALIWMSLFAEMDAYSGKLSAAFNFSWGAHFAMSFLFIATMRHWLQGEYRGASWKNILIGVALCAHILSGTYWIAKQLGGLSYH